MKGNMSNETIKPSPIIETTTASESRPRNKFTIPLAITSALAIIGIGFGVYEFIQVSEKTLENRALESRIATLEQESSNKSSDAADTFYVHGMGIKIKGLNDYAIYSLKRGAAAPFTPRKTFTIGHASGVPTFSDGTPLGLDGVPAYESAAIYEYGSEEEYNNAENCSAKIGKIGESYYCVERLHYPEEFDNGVYEGEIRDAWINWFNAGTDKIMETLSNPENYSAI